MNRETNYLLPTTTLANAILKTGGVDLAASLLDALLSCEDDERLTDGEALEGSALFDELCRLCPDAVLAAQHRQGVLTDSELATAQKVTA